MFGVSLFGSSTHVMKRTNLINNQVVILWTSAQNAVAM